MAVLTVLVSHIVAVITAEAKDTAALGFRLRLWSCGDRGRRCRRGCRCWSWSRWRRRLLDRDIDPAVLPLGHLVAGLNGQRCLAEALGVDG